MSIIEDRREAFKRWMSENDIGVSEIHKRAGVPKTTLYSYLDGKSDSMKGTTESKIAEAFGLTVERLFTSHVTASSLGVWGKIGARAEVYPLSDYSSVPMYEVALPPPLDPETEYVAFEIEGFSMPPAEPGWLAVFRNVECTVLDLINSPCLIDTADGRRLFKRLRPGYLPGVFNLESWDGSPLMENVEVLRALPFAALTPGRKAR